MMTWIRLPPIRSLQPAVDLSEKRHPRASTTSALPAASIATSSQSCPTESGELSGKAPLAEIVDATGIPSDSASCETSPQDWDVFAPPPMIIRGLSACSRLLDVMVSQFGSILLGA